MTTRDKYIADIKSRAKHDLGQMGMYEDDEVKAIKKTIDWMESKGLIK